MFEFEFKKVFSDGREKIVESAFGLLWYKNGELHRNNDLPAVIYPNGRKEWWENGKFIKIETK